MKRYFAIFVVAKLVAVIVLPASLEAATKPLEISGWIPYWRTATGTAVTLPNLDLLTEVNPFVYTVKRDGTLVDNGTLDEEPWKSFIAEAKKKKIRVIPTIMWSDAEAMHRILSVQKTRVELAKRITALVKEKNFDGIDIDFEGKRAETKDYFSTFLKGLYMRMGKKWVMCTIESRTPLESRYYGTDIPKDAAIVANDFVAINKYCDRVRIMAYDQQGIDQKLAAQAASSSELYAPVGDIAWVEKVMTLVAKTIDKKKLMIGVPTYGYEYDVTAYANNEYIYDIKWTFNPGYAHEIAATYGVTPQRNRAGELYFTYTPRDVVTGTSTISQAPNSAHIAAAAASLYATTYNGNSTFRMVTWADAQSLKDKIALAKKLGLRGVSIFKLDGGHDPKLWDVLREAQNP